MNRLFDKLPIIGNKISGKIVLSFLMFMLTIVLWFILPNYLKFLCIFSMLFSFIGDCFLNHNKNHENQSKTDFILGGLSFIIAHSIYFTIYFTKIKMNNYSFVNNGFIFTISLLTILTAVIIISVIIKKTFTKLCLLGIFYLWITGINYLAIFSYAYSSYTSINSLVALGGFLFLLSDVIICFEKFLGLKSKIARELVWWFYPIGQIILIVMV